MPNYILQRSILFIALIMMLGACATSTFSNDPVQLETEAQATLAKFTEDNPESAALAEEALGILVFPSIAKGGFIYGGQYGRGAMFVDDTPTEYYSSSAASYGFQAGGQRFSYIMYIMDQDALDYVNNTEGFEVGVGPSITLFNAGVARSLTTSTLRDDIYVCIFDAQGLMAGSGLQGTKITRLDLD